MRYLAAFEQAQAASFQNKKMAAGVNTSAAIFCLAPYLTAATKKPRCIAATGLLII
jgi:hypothetical protein